MQFEGDAEDIETLKRLFAKFPSPQRPRPDVSVVLDLNRCSWTTAQSSGSIRLLDNRAATAAATMLLARLLSETGRDFVVLHGNGLSLPDITLPDGRAVLLLGDSGAGKTTLTRVLLGDEFGLSQIAEDVLVIDPATGLLHPFPRALAIRTGEEALGDEASFGFAHETRQGRPLEEFSAAARAIPLAGSAVFLLSLSEPMPAQTPNVTPSGGGERAWISWADDSTLGALRAGGLPVSNVRIGSSVAVVDFERALSNEERANQHRLFDRLEIMHLHSAPIGAGQRDRSENPIESKAPSGHRPRPEMPQCKPLGAGDGIRSCLTHLRRVAGAESGGEAGRVYFRLARTLSSSRFYRLVPGGTPQETAALLMESAAGETSPV